MGKKVLVLGSAGQSGLHVCKELLARGYRIIALFNATKPNLESPFVEYVKGDAPRFQGS